MSAMSAMSATPAMSKTSMYLPPVLEALGLAEVEHTPRNNRVRALGKKP